jgi:hypothetical protein
MEEKKYIFIAKIIFLYSFIFFILTKHVFFYKEHDF